MRYMPSRVGPQAPSNHTSPEDATISRKCFAMKKDDLFIRERLETLYTTHHDDAFVSDTISRLPARHGRRIWLIAFFVIVWGTFFGITIAYRATLLEALKEVVNFVLRIDFSHPTFPSSNAIISLAIVILLFVVAVRESCQAVTDYVARQQ